MNQYQFEKIERQMKKEFGSISRGDEDKYAVLMFLMEHNLLIRIRELADVKDSEIRTAFLLVLHRINRYLKNEEEDLSDFETGNIKELANAIQMAFDWNVNQDIQKAVSLDMSDAEAVKKYYTVPVKCILRTLSSVDFWNKHRGKRGYISRLEEDVSKLGVGDKMQFAILASEETSIIQTD